jgi:hypothetical protein
MEVMPMDMHDDQAGMEEIQGIQGAGEGEGVPPRTGPPEIERKRRKVSLIGAIVVNVVTLITLAIVLLAILLPGYRRSFTVARAVGGAEEVWIIVRTTEARMRENSTDFIKAQDGLRNALQEEVNGGSSVWAYVRDNFPDQDWVKENLPEDIQNWLEELYPQPEQTQENTPGQTIQGVKSQPEEEQPAGAEGP